MCSKRRKGLLVFQKVELKYVAYVKAIMKRFNRTRIKAHERKKKVFSNTTGHF